MDRRSRLVSILVNAEMGYAIELRDIAFHSSLDGNWEWLLVHARGIAHAVLLEILQGLSPIKSGELAGLTAEEYLYFSADGFPPQKSERSLILKDPDFVSSCPNHVREILAPPQAGHDRDILYVRTVSEGSPLDADKLIHQVRAETWLSSRAQPHRLASREFTVTVGLQRRTVRPTRESELFDFEAHGNYYAAFSSASSENVSFNYFIQRKHRLVLPKSDFLSAVQFPAADAYGYAFGICAEFDAFGPSSATSDLNKIAKSDLAALPEVVRLKLHSKIRDWISAKRNETLEEVRRRRDKLEKRKKIILAKNGRLIDLGYEPANEHETIILAVRLEPQLNETMGVFKILEHTPKLGIDGLIQAKKTPDNLPSCFTVEFEYSLDGFFKHQHPLGQTDFIICWTLGKYRDGDFPFGDDSALRATLARFQDWRRTLTVAGHMIHVLPLSEYPGVRRVNK